MAERVADRGIVSAAVLARQHDHGDVANLDELRVEKGLICTRVGRACRALLEMGSLAQQTNPQTKQPSPITKRVGFGVNSGGAIQTSSFSTAFCSICRPTRKLMSNLERRSQGESSISAEERLIGTQGSYERSRAVNQRAVFVRSNFFTPWCSNIQPTPVAESL